MAGAPKGNTNALKHGLYAIQFNDDQRAGLKKMAWSDFRHEEFAHRAIGACIWKLLNQLLQQRNPDPKDISALAYALSLNTSAITGSARTHALLNGEEEHLGDALSQALEDVPFDIGDDDPQPPA